MTPEQMAQKVIAHGGHYDISGDETVALAEAYLALQRENAKLREAIERIGWHEVTSWMEARNIARAALTPSAAPGEGETR